MLAYMPATDFTLNRPQTSLGWILLILAATALGWIILRGSISLFTSMHDRLKPTFYFFLAATFLLIFQQTIVDNPGPIIQTDIGGVSVETSDPGQP